MSRHGERDEQADSDRRFRRAQGHHRPLPASRKIYSVPDAAPDLRVPLREIALAEGSGETPLPVYDTTGPYTDPDVAIDVEKGLARTHRMGARARRRRGI